MRSPAVPRKRLPASPSAVRGRVEEEELLNVIEWNALSPTYSRLEENAMDSKAVHL